MEWISKREQEKRLGLSSSGQFEVRNGKKVYKDDLLIGISKTNQTSCVISHAPEDGEECIQWEYMFDAV